MEDWTDIRERVASGKVSKRAILHDLHAHYDQQYGLAWENLAEKIQDSGLGRDIRKKELERFINEAVGVAEHEVNLTAFGAEVGREELQAQRLQVRLRRTLAELPAPEMLRLVGASEGFDRLPQILGGFHGMTNSPCPAFSGAKLRR